ncbi:MAG: DUF420 domain-containing protein [Saprospiraceae bacterium]|nr:DUF420 domain-containing protein [Saprospiraceae bacterium]HPG05489.1 DUF420 domain-containing protein [Saprospiraceae bacterium]HQU53105.1 DUF420 domain-containing protein [Saprospiraceae bacterium]
MSQPDLKLARKLNVIAYIVSFVVLLLVALMRQFKFETEVDFSILPPFHATLNALTAVILVLAYIAVKRKKISLHRKLMITALITSLIFLISYVLYHITTEETRFCQPGAIRYVYFFLLMTHILLAAVSFPLVLFTFIRGYTGQIVQHRKMARWVYPLWLYVAITGPVCYLMLMPCYS